jgi:hypothetical protein
MVMAIGTKVLKVVRVISYVPVMLVLIGQLDNVIDFLPLGNPPFPCALFAQPIRFSNAYPSGLLPFRIGINLRMSGQKNTPFFHDFCPIYWLLSYPYVVFWITRTSKFSPYSARLWG